MHIAFDAPRCDRLLFHRSFHVFTQICHRAIGGCIRIGRQKCASLREWCGRRRRHGMILLPRVVCGPWLAFRSPILPAFEIFNLIHVHCLLNRPACHVQFAGTAIPRQSRRCHQQQLLQQQQQQQQANLLSILRLALQQRPQRTSIWQRHRSRKSPLKQNQIKKAVA